MIHKFTLKLIIAPKLEYSQKSTKQKTENLLFLFSLLGFLILTHYICGIFSDEVIG